LGSSSGVVLPLSSSNPQFLSPVAASDEVGLPWVLTGQRQQRLVVANNHWLGMRGPLQIKSFTLPVAALPPGLAHVRIAHISDLHVDFNTLPWLTAAFQAVNDLKPDMVLITGDFVTKGSKWLPQVTALLKTLTCPHVFTCMGNHDYMDGHKGKRLRQALQAANVDVLVNDRALIHRQWGALQIAGVDDWVKGKPRAKFLQRSLDKSLPTILLCHNPAQLEDLPQWPGVMLALCGHTHGGQFGLPDFVMRHVVGTKYVKGVIPVGNTVVSVSNGIGTASITLGKRWYRVNIPMPRFMTPAEVSVWTLEPK
jgi:uncharacterized protein